MKKLALALAPLALVLAACASPAHTETETKTVTAPAPTVSSPEPIPTPSKYLPTANPSGYYPYVVSQSPVLKAVDEASVLELGYNICSAIGQGTPVQDIVAAGIQSGLDSTSTAALIAGAVVYLCPEYYETVQSQV